MAVVYSLRASYWSIQLANNSTSSLGLLLAEVMAIILIVLHTNLWFTVRCHNVDFQASLVGLVSCHKSHAKALFEYLIF